MTPLLFLAAICIASASGGVLLNSTHVLIHGELIREPLHIPYNLTLCRIVSTTFLSEGRERGLFSGAVATKRFELLNCSLDGFMGSVLFNVTAQEYMIIGNRITNCSGQMLVASWPYNQSSPW